MTVLSQLWSRGTLLVRESQKLGDRCSGSMVVSAFQHDQ